MSSASPYESDSAAAERSSTAELSIDPVLPVRFAGFWTAVVTPFVLLGLLVIGMAQQSPELLGGLLVANVTGIVLGSDYKR